MEVYDAIKIMRKACWHNSQRLLDAVYGPQAKHVRRDVINALFPDGRPNGRGAFTESSPECQFGKLRDALFAALHVDNGPGSCLATREQEFEAKAREFLECPIAA